MNKELTPLDALKHLESIVEIEMDEINYKEDISIIENALKEFEILVKIHAITIDAMKSIEKSLKALDIIKEKNVDVLRIKITDSVEQYNEHKIKGCRNLTKEEYETLKKVLL